MLRKVTLAVLLMMAVIPGLPCAQAGTGNVVDVRIVSDHENEFKKYRVYPRVRQESNYFYVEAVKGGRYSIQVTNKSDKRIGTVIAVDGRNIIDGEKSDLKQNERMYIVEPYGSNTFEGWRTGMNRTNRFYFTEQADSYAEKAFADASAMGTIALAVYREKIPKFIPQTEKPFSINEVPAGAAPFGSGESRSAGKAEGKKLQDAGTGFGETTYSPALRVHFDPEHVPAEKIILKYEWRSELCRKGVITCGPKNRFWPDDYKFAPTPNDFKG
jgi:hypothetical protein